MIEIRNLYSTTTNLNTKQTYKLSGLIVLWGAQSLHDAVIFRQ